MIILGGAMRCLMYCQVCGDRQDLTDVQDAFKAAVTPLGVAFGVPASAQAEAVVEFLRQLTDQHAKTHGNRAVTLWLDWVEG